MCDDGVGPIEPAACSSRRSLIEEDEREAKLQFQQNSDIQNQYFHELVEVLSKESKVKGTEITSVNKIKDLLRPFTDPNCDPRVQYVFFEGIHIMKVVVKNKHVKKQECKAILQRVQNIGGRCSKYKIFQIFVFGLYKDIILYYLKYSLYMTPKTHPVQCAKHNNLPILTFYFPESKQFDVTHGAKDCNGNSIFTVTSIVIDETPVPVEIIASTIKSKKPAKPAKKDNKQSHASNKINIQEQKERILQILQIHTSEEKPYMQENEIKTLYHKLYCDTEKVTMKASFDELVSSEEITRHKNSYKLNHKPAEKVINLEEPNSITPVDFDFSEHERLSFFEDFSNEIQF